MSYREPSFFAPNNAFGALTQPLFQQHSEGCKTRCFSHLRDAGPEKLVAEVNIISVALNQASLFSLYWDFEKIFYNIEKVWRFRQWGLCVCLLLTCEFSRVRAVPFHVSVFSTWYTQQVLECFERMNEWEEREKSDMPMVVSVSGIDAGLCENKQTNKKQGTVQGSWDKIWPVFVKSEKFECCPSPEKGTVLPWPFS